MNMNKLKLYTIALVAFLLLPTSSQAYFTTSQSATQITNDTILYTVTYEFGFPSRELYMPIMTLRGLEATETSPLAGFTIFSDEDEIFTEGIANGLVLTSSNDVEIKDNQYYVPAGKSAKFTMLTLVTIPEANRTEDLNLFMEVTKLPFTMVKDGLALPNHLNPSELQYYKTPSISL